MIMDLQMLEDQAAKCTLCDLHSGRVNPVFAKGNNNADIMICGMVPAKEENKLGLPFVGRAGKLLDELLFDCNLSLDSVYITNLVKCFLAAGKPLEADWVKHCLPYLVVQIQLVQPKVILTLGKDAAFALLGLDQKQALGSVVGKEFFAYNTKVVPTYHPSYILRKGGKNAKEYQISKQHMVFACNLI